MPPRIPAIVNMEIVRGYTTCPACAPPSVKHDERQEMENIPLTLLILTIAAAATVLALRNRGSRTRPGDDHLSSARQHREITRRYREEQASLSD